MPRTKPKAKPSDGGRPVSRAERVAKIVAVQHPCNPSRPGELDGFLDDIEKSARTLLGDLGATATPTNQKQIWALRTILSRLHLLDRARATGDRDCLAHTSLVVGYLTGKFGREIGDAAAKGLDTIKTNHRTRRDKSRALFAQFRQQNPDASTTTLRGAIADELGIDPSTALRHTRDLR